MSPKYSRADMLAALVEASRVGDIVRVRELLDKLANLSTPDVNLDHALTLAVRSGHMVVAKALLDAGASVSAVDANNDTVLGVAEVTGRVDTVKLLVEHKANVNSVTGADGVTVAMRAAARGDEDMLRYLVDAKASLSLTDANGWDVLDWAMEKNQTAMARTLMHQYRVGAQQDTNGRTALIAKVIAGDTCKVQALMAAGVDVNAVDDVGLPALAYAAVCGRRDIVQMLLDAKAAPIAASEGLQALMTCMTCMERGDGNVMEALLCANSGPYPRDYESVAQIYLFWAADNGFVDVMKLMVAAGANVNARTKYQYSPYRNVWKGGRRTSVWDQYTPIQLGVSQSVTIDIQMETPLHLASRKGYAVVVKALLNARACVDANGNGGKILYEAVMEGHAEVVQLLLAAGVDVRFKFNGRSLLQQAAINGSVAVVEALLARGAPVDERAELTTASSHTSQQNPVCDAARRLKHLIYLSPSSMPTCTPLHLACYFGHAAVVTALLTAGAYINKEECMELCIAAQSGRVDVVKALLAAGVDVTRQGGELVPLREAAMMDQAAVVEVLLAAGAPLCRQTAKGESMFRVLCQSGDEAVVQLFINAGVDIEEADEYGLTALAYAAVRGEYNIVKLLLDARAAPIAASEGLTALTVRLRTQGDVVKALIQAPCPSGRHRPRTDDLSTIHWAAKHGYADVVKLMLSTNQSIYGYDESRRMSLVYACESGNVAIVDMLLAFGACVDDTYREDRTPLLVACEKGHVAVVKRVMAASTRTLSGMEGYPALRKAVENGHAEVVVTLLAAGASMTVPVATCPLLHLASAKGHVPVVKVLLAAGADVNHKDDKGKIALHVASASNHAEVVETLLAAGALVDARDSTGQNAMCVACVRGNVAVVETLLAAGVCVDEVDEAGLSMLAYAALSGNREVVQVLVEAGTAPITGSDGLIDLTKRLGRSDGDVMEALLCAEPLLSMAKYSNHEDVMTPLDLAAADGFVDVVKLILVLDDHQHGKLDLTSALLHFALNYACGNGYVDIVDMLLKVSPGPSTGRACTRTHWIKHLNMACNYGNAEVAKKLLSAYEYTQEEKDRMLYQGDCVEVTKVLLAAGADVNGLAGARITPLMGEAAEGSKDIVEVLLAAGADVDAVDVKGWSAFFFACLHGNVEVARMLLAAGARTDDVDSIGINVLTYATASGHADIVALLVDSKAASNAACPRPATRIRQPLAGAGEPSEPSQFRGEPHLMWAADNDNAGMARLLLDLPAASAKKNYLVAEMLPIAAKFGSINVLNILLDATTSLCETTRQSLLNLACTRGHEAVLERLLKVGAVDNKTLGELLIIAAEEGQVEVVRVLLDAGTYVDARDSKGQTPLFHASAKGHDDVVQVLLAAGAAVNYHGTDGRTAVYMAILGDHTEVIRAFLDAFTASDAPLGAEQDSLPAYIWCRAADYRRHEVVQLLLDRGIDVEVCNDEGTNALHLATANRDLRMLGQLLAAGVQPNSRDSDGDTALHRAVADGSHSVAKVLLEAGVGVNEVDRSGATPLLHAVLKGDHKMVDLLLAAKAPPTVTTSQLCELVVELGLADPSPQNVVDEVMEKVFNPKHVCSLNSLSKGVHWAAQRGYADMVVLLLNAGANVDSCFETVFEETDEETDATDSSDDDEDLYGENDVEEDFYEDEDENVHEDVLVYEEEYEVDEDEDEDEDGNEAEDEGENEEWTTALYEACKRGHVAVVEVLVDAEADVDKLSGGYTPLCTAARRGHLTIVQLLLAAKADVGKKCKDTYKPLHRAAEKGHVSVVKTLLDAGADLESFSGKWIFSGCPYTPLGLASKRGHVEVVQMLLDALDNASLGQKLGNRNHALVEASLANKVAVVKVLLARGLEVDLIPVEISTALFFAVNEGHTAVVDTVIESVMSADTGCQTRILHSCCKDGCVESVEVLLNAGVCDVVTGVGPTALHLAVQHDFPRMVELLCMSALKNL